MRTSVGYAGGQTPNPTYRNIGDHAEAIRIDYDPQTIGYAQLIRYFFSEHRPINPPWSSQYRSAIFCNDQDELQIAEQIRDEHQQHWGACVHTEIKIETGYTLAEDYHQKYRLQRHVHIMNELRAIYPDFWDIVASPTAMRLNAVVGGYLKKDRLNQELPTYGLLEETQQKLLKKRL